MWCEEVSLVREANLVTQPGTILIFMPVSQQCMCIKWCIAAKFCGFAHYTALYVQHAFVFTASIYIILSVYPSHPQVQSSPISWLQKVAMFFEISYFLTCTIALYKNPDIRRYNSHVGDRFLLYTGSNFHSGLFHS